MAIKVLDSGFADARIRTATAPSQRSAWIADVRIDRIDFAEAVEKIIARASERRGTAYVVTPNAHHVVLLQRDLQFKHIYESAFLVVADGVPLLWAGELLHERLRGRVNGTDLLEELCAVSARIGLRVFLLGGREGAADAAAAALQSRSRGLQICGTYCPPVGFERDPAENAKIVDTINAAKPDIIFVGLGAPKQEYWMYANRARIDAGVALGIGVSFELVAGIVPRAPKWMQVSGLEWLFRLCSEPSRLWRRYLIGNAVFCALIFREFYERWFFRDGSDRAPSRRLLALQRLRRRRA